MKLCLSVNIIISYLHIGTEKLTSEKLDSHVKEVSPQWYKLGIQLLKKQMIHQLEIIKEKNLNDVVKCVEEMIKYWLSNFEATVNKMIDALTKMHQTELVEDIKRNNDIKGLSN